MAWLDRTVLIAGLALAGCGHSGKAIPETIAHPDRGGARIEYFAEQPAGSGPWPTVIFLHGHQSATARIGGRAYANWGVLDRFAKRGYLAVAISLPGYGGSSGPEDFAGPFSQHAVQAVMAALEADHKAAPNDVLIEGVSLGAVTAALVAAHDPHIKGLVLISGLYDLAPFFAHPKSAGAAAVKAAAIAQIGGSAAALQARSALLLAPRIHAATLILNGGKDDRTYPDQARQLAAAITAHGGRAEAHIYPDFAHEIPLEARDAQIDRFIDRTLRH